MSNKFIAIDLFSGCGGLSEGLKSAGFGVSLAVEIDADAARTYRLNHSTTTLLEKDIREVTSSEMRKAIHADIPHLLAGCPPCQGFSSMRRLNRTRSIQDKRNSLIMEFGRCVKMLKPLTIMMENVPALENYYLFKTLVKELEALGYHLDWDVVNVRDYGVPQSRRRLVLVGSRLGEIKVAGATTERTFVRNVLEGMGLPEDSRDKAHKIFYSPGERILKLFQNIPLNGGSRKDLSDDLILACHKKKGVGFNDVYGRMNLDKLSPTITAGCLNPSKGRFLHPTQHRSISAREAALLQSFPRNYKFPDLITKKSIASQIGNALPPKFSYYQALNIKEHLLSYLG